ncbi:MAG: glutamine--fructose-6-phosphate transaminase (isomerizing), partial [Planctomycetota bacterium]
EGEVAKVDRSGVEIFGRGFERRRRRPMEVPWEAEGAAKGGYAHFMLKEISEQPQTLAAEGAGRDGGLGGELRLSAGKLRRAVLAGCGTAWHAALVGKMALEELAGLPAEAGLSSELRYGDGPWGPETLVVAISQSGETADTLAAVRRARRAGAPVVAVTNLRGSTLAREADQVLYMRAGLEVGVAATKTYTSQLALVTMLAAWLGRQRGALSGRRFRELMAQGRRLPEAAGRVLSRAQGKVRELARRLRRGYDFMYIGRRYNLATALEGALKMKEISYLHAEGYGAGEMKHGPLALVDERLACVAVAPQGRVTEKMISNIEEIRARGGGGVAVATEGDRRVAGVADAVIEIPACEEVFSPILAVMPLQLLAYHVAVELGRDVDRPRNLAKSVTVE